MEGMNWQFTNKGYIRVSLDCFGLIGRHMEMSFKGQPRNDEHSAFLYLSSVNRSVRHCFGLPIVR
jgi:hypothetical protein